GVSGYSHRRCTSRRHGDSPYCDAVASIWFRQFGQYQGAGLVTGFGLLLRHLAQRKRLPFTVVLGRTLLPVLRMCFAITPPSWTRPSARSAGASRRRADAPSGRGPAAPTRSDSPPAAPSTRPAAATNTSSNPRRPKGAA